MSFILDALRKSEHERQRHSGPLLAAAPGTSRTARTPWIFVGLGFLLALNLVGLVAFWIWRETRETASLTPPRGSPPSVVAVDPATRSPAPATVPERLIRPLTDEAIETGPELPPAAAPAAPEPELLPEAPAGRTTMGAATVPPAGATRPAADPAGVPTLDELGPSATAGLPVLNLDLHVYLPDPSRRFVFINGTRYAEGAALKEGPIVERITRDGAVLNHRGVRFLLQRP